MSRNTVQHRSPHFGNYIEKAGSVTSKFGKKELKSGFHDTPGSQVLVKLKWPHMNQNPRYVTEGLKFNQLTFPQFVGGECRTILRTTDTTEINGRLRILSKVAYLYEQCKNWERARSIYFAIVSSIEEGEAKWGSSFGHYDLMCPVWVENKYEPKSENKGLSNNKVWSVNTMKHDFYCRDFQKGDCIQTAPHRAWIRNNSEVVEHFCVSCFRARMGKLPHTPGSEGCSQAK